MEKNHFNIPLKKWINATKIALIIIDMQKGIKSDDYAPLKCEKSYGLGNESINYMKNRIDTVILNISKLLNFFRRNDLMVIFTKIGHQYKNFIDSPTIHKKRFDELYNLKGQKFYMMPGCDQYEVLKEIEPLEKEMVLKKTTSNTFTGTPLNLILRNNNIDRLIIVGALTSCCVESTAREAFDLGYLPTVAEDACIAADKGFHESSIRVLRTYYANVMSTNEILNNLEGHLPEKTKNN